MDQNTVLIALTIDENLKTIAIPTNGGGVWCSR